MKNVPSKIKPISTVKEKKTHLNDVLFTMEKLH